VVVLSGWMSTKGGVGQFARLCQLFHRSADRPNLPPRTFTNAATVSLLGPSWVAGLIN